MTAHAGTLIADRWQFASFADDCDQHAELANEETPNGFEPAGPWFPFGFSTAFQHDNEYTGGGYIMPYVAWRRPLRKVAP